MPLDDVVNRLRNRAPSPSTQAKTEPITVSSASVPPAEHGQQQGEGDTPAVEAEAEVDPERQRGQRPGEGHVGQGVAGEHLAPQDDDVADQARGHGDGRAGAERRLEERVGEHEEGGGRHAPAIPGGADDGAPRAAAGWPGGVQRSGARRTAAGRRGRRRTEGRHEEARPATVE